MRTRAQRHFEADLERLATQVTTGKLMDPARIHQRIGRLRERYPSIAGLYELTVTETGPRLQVGWQARPERWDWVAARDGAYLLRTNLIAAHPTQLWEQYVQLTEVEAAFRALKSELAIRPLWHQTDARVQAHILVAFVGYALWVALKHTLKRAGSPLSPAHALDRLRGIQSGDLLLETTDGRTLRLRRVSRADRQQQLLLAHLGLTLPERLGVDVECSGDSATPPPGNQALAGAS